MYFSDLEEMSWAASYVDEIAAQEVVPMSGAFRPAETASAADLIVALYAASSDGQADASAEDAAAGPRRRELRLPPVY